MYNTRNVDGGHKHPSFVVERYAFLNYYKESSFFFDDRAHNERVLCTEQAHTARKWAVQEQCVTNVSKPKKQSVNCGKINTTDHGET